MNQNVIDRFNAGSVVNDAAYEKAERAGFPWLFFWERVVGKARESGFLPNEACILIDARYCNSAEQVVRDVFASIESIESSNMMLRWYTPWLDGDMQRWKSVLCSLTCTLFDAGVVAAMTRSPEGEEDPILRNGGWSIFGDVGFLRLREKSVKFVRECGGEEAVRIMGEVGDCACLHLYADCKNSERAFKLAAPVREAYVRNACRAAYFAGAVFGERLRR